MLTGTMHALDKPAEPPAPEFFQPGQVSSEGVYIIRPLPESVRGWRTPAKNLGAVQRRKKRKKR